MPARAAGDRIVPVLDRLFAAVRLSCEVLVVDAKDDVTRPVVERHAGSEPRLACLVSTYGPGPANAIRFGMDRQAGGPLLKGLLSGLAARAIEAGTI